MNLKTIVYSALCIATASTTCAITPRNTVTEELIKPDNAVNRQLAAAPGSLESLPGWYDGKYWSIWADKKHVPAESVEEIWYALADAPIPGSGQKRKDFLRYSRPADWTTDEAGNVLLIFVDPVGNWNNGYYVIYRRNDRDMFEYSGVVHVGSHIGGWKNEIEFVKEGFILTFNNIKGRPPIRHLFRYDNPEDFCIHRNAQ
ncbi:MAG: hypothetical protein IJA81_05805 [Akkermansia sp.]|nr:hypothetical protein [Akkermansia sp.]